MFKRMAIIAVMFCMGLTGCDFINPISPIIQIGMYWLEGEAHKYYNTDQATMVTSVKTSLKDLHFSILEEGPESDYYWIKATDGSKVKLESGEMAESHFKIKIREVKQNITKLSVRVNTFGDNPYVEMFYRNVDKQPGVIQFTTIEELNAAYKQRDRKVSK